MASDNEEDYIDMSQHQQLGGGGSRAGGSGSH